MIEVTKYKLSCDVEGCDKQLEGSPTQVAASGWGAKVMYSGSPSFVEFSTAVTPYSMQQSPTVCSSCKAQGFYKRMTKE